MAIAVFSGIILEASPKRLLLVEPDEPHKPRWLINIQSTQFHELKALIGRHLTLRTKILYGPLEFELLQWETSAEKAVCGA